MDPLQFLRSVPPFDHLSDDELDQIAEGLETVFFPAGTMVAAEGEPRLEHLFVIRKGAVSVREEGGPPRSLETGESFGLPAGRGLDRAPSSIAADTDVLAFRIPSAQFEKLLHNPEFAGFFTRTLPDRLRTLTDLQLSSLAGDMASAVGGLRRRPLVAIAPDTAIGVAARVMREERVSSVVIDGNPPGIVTDRDLRNRVLADGVDPQTPVELIMTSPLKTIDAASPAYGAFLLMLDQRIHHVPITENGKVVGLVTDGDLLRHQSKTPIYLLKWIDRLARPNELSGYATDIAGMAEMLFGAGLDPLRIARVIASLNDAVTRRLLALAAQELGPAPTAYGWLVFGSEGRMEQVLLTDQDNALALATTGEDVEDYFADLARFVVGGLLDAGFPPCRANCVATHLRYPVSDWHNMLLTGIARPDRESIMDASVIYDFRMVAGELDTAQLESAVLQSAAQPAFMQKLARSVVRKMPPMATLASMGGIVDLKRTGVTPIVGLARLYALAAGARGPSTLDRLQHASAAGILPEAQAETLIEAFRFLLTVRMRSQLEALQRSEQPSNIVKVRELSIIEQKHLKETFAEIRTVLHKTSRRWHTFSVR